MIEIKREDHGLGPPYENCCFCFRPTPYWNEVRDVPVCESCAPKHEQSQVPTKQDWDTSVNRLVKKVKL